MGDWVNKKEHRLSFEKLIKKPFAHRGLHDEMNPENSVGAFENAIKNNYAIELDVRLLKDGEVVVFHDSNLRRMCGLNKKLKMCTFSEIKELSLLQTKFTIPKLKDVLRLVDGSEFVLIEIKGRLFDRKLEKAVLNEIINYSGDYAIQSFNPLSLKWFKKHAGYIARGYLASFFNGSKSLFKKLVKRLCFAKSCDINFISYDFKYLPNKYVEKFMCKKKVPLLAFTITSEEEFNEVKSCVSNIIFENFNPGK